MKPSIANMCREFISAVLSLFGLDRAFFLFKKKKERGSCKRGPLGRGAK